MYHKLMAHNEYRVRVEYRAFVKIEGAAIVQPLTAWGDFSTDIWEDCFVGGNCTGVGGSCHVAYGGSLVKTYYLDCELKHGSTVIWHPGGHNSTSPIDMGTDQQPLQTGSWSVLTSGSEADKYGHGISNSDHDIVCNNGYPCLAPPWSLPASMTV
jgi:hypothetical protein